MSFFSKLFRGKIPAVKPIFGQKHVNSVKTPLYYGFKKSIGYPFFLLFFTKKTAVMAIFCQKHVLFHKNTPLSCPNFVQKTNSLKHTVHSYHIFQIFHEKPLLSYPCLVKKTSILSKLHYISVQKSQKDSLFSDF